MDKANAFKDVAQKMGYTEQEINDFISTVPEDQYKQRSYERYLTENPQQNNPIMGENMSLEGYSPEEQSVVRTILQQKKEQYTPSIQAEPETYEYESQYGILPKEAKITQRFGNYNPSVERFSGGINYGTDFGVTEGTPIALPEGEWEIVESFNGARRGFVGDSTNQGYGNSVLAKNRKTGEMIRLSHLSTVGVQPGELIRGGTVIGESGSTGNSTAGHLDAEYYNARGEIADIMQSPYGKYMFGGKKQAMAPSLDLTL